MHSVSTQPQSPSTERPAALGWVPCAFVVDLPAAGLLRVEVRGVGFVLFRDAQGDPAALRDVCPHRKARLSDGRWCEGRVECGYHGWSFDGDGSCRAIPQLEAGRPIPAAARARAVPVQVAQGLIWLFDGDPDRAEASRVPTIEALDDPACRSVDFAMDLPYGADYLIENVLDYAHIHVAHDGTMGGGARELAGPLAFEIEDLGADGFRGRLGALRDGQLDAGPGIASAGVAFGAPGLVHYHTAFADGRFSGLALYAVPIHRPGAPRRCRLFYRAYGNHWRWRDRLRPRFVSHLHLCHLLEEDMGIIRGQAAELDGEGAAALGAQWLPLKTSDALVLEFRRWVDEHGAGLRASGLRSPRPEGEVASDTSAATDRWSLHTRTCLGCQKAVEWVRIARRLAVVVSLAALVVAFGLATEACRLPVAIAGCSVVVALGSGWLGRSFSR